MNTKPKKVPRTQQWKDNTAARRERLRQQGGGPFFAMLDGAYAAKMNAILEWRDPAWRKNHGRPINKTDLLKLMIDAELNQVNRRRRVTARRSGQDAALTSAAARHAPSHP